VDSAFLGSEADGGDIGDVTCEVTWQRARWVGDLTLPLHCSTPTLPFNHKPRERVEDQGRVPPYRLDCLRAASCPKEKGGAVRSELGWGPSG
jgi:hypothetical protein